jgi:hypothetical protein
MHAEIPITGLRRGDVLALSGWTVALRNVDEQGNYLDGTCYDAEVFGTLRCPMFVCERIELYRNWPTTGHNPRKIVENLQAYLSAPELQLELDQTPLLPTNRSTLPGQD